MLTRQNVNNDVSKDPPILLGREKHVSVIISGLAQNRETGGQRSNFDYFLQILTHLP